MNKTTTLALALAATLLAGTAAAASKGEVLVLLSSESQLPLKDGKQYATGYYLNEFGVPADQLLKAGYTLVLVTPNGNAPSVDKRSIDPKYFGDDEAQMKRIQSLVEGLPGINDSLSLKEVLDGDLDRDLAGCHLVGHAVERVRAHGDQVAGDALAHRDPVPG